MFNAGTIFAKMKLDSTGFNTSVEASKQKLAGLRGAITSTSFLLNTALAGGAALAARKLFEMGEQGAKIKDLQTSFGKLAASAGVNGNIIVEQTKKITGALTDQQIIKSANMLEVLGVGMENLPKLTQIAASSARALGQDIGYMLESIATGTARQSRLWLDNLGIIIDAEKAYADYAKTLGKTAKELTDVEQRAAFLNAVLAKGDEIVGRLGTGTESAAEGFASFAASVTNLSDSFKVALGDMGPFMAKLAQLVEWGNTHGIWLKRGVGIMFTRPEAAQPYGTLPGGGPSMFQQAAAQMRAEAEARAQQGRINAPVGAAGAVTPMGPLGGGILGAGMGSFLAEPGLTQSAQALDFLSEKFFRLQDVATGFGDAIATAFHTLITDSKNAAKAFASAFLSSIGRVASNLGDLLITSAIGFEALGNLAWPLALGMGLALKALGGTLSGLGQKAAPAGMTSAYAPPSRVEADAVGGSTIIIQGDFNGDPVWIDRLAEKIRLAGRDRGVKVVWEGA